MRLEIATPAGIGWIDLDRPPRARALIALTHGAGGGVETADLLAIRSAALAARVAVALITQPYRVAGRRSPPKPGPQDEAWTALVAALRARRGLTALPFIVGGRSNGARVACRTAVMSGAAAVVALAFPLQPPSGKPPQSRLSELAAAGVPTLVVQGDRDPFGLPPRGRGRRVVVVPGDHSLKRDPGAVAGAVIAFVSPMLAEQT